MAVTSDEIKRLTSEAEAAEREYMRHQKQAEAAMKSWKAKSDHLKTKTDEFQREAAQQAELVRRASKAIAA